MPEIEEVEVISSGGVPFYYHSNSGKEQDDAYLLQASFITALSQFADELNNGEIKLISMEKKHYLLTKSPNFTIIFTSNDEEPDTLISYRPQITDVKEYLNTKLEQTDLDLMNPNNQELDKPIQDFDAYLKHLDLVEGENKYSSSTIKQDLDNLIFKSVGYEPGKCNIGRAERMKRLVFGLTGFTVSLLIYAVIFIFSLPTLLVAVLVIPNFFGFLGLFQYQARFCTTNALSQQYDMN